MLHKNYKPSGKVTFWGILLFVLLGLAGCCLIESAYVILMGFVSNVFLRLVIVAFCVILSGWWIVALGRIGKLRRPKLIRIMALIILIISFYMSRCVYVDLVQSFWSDGSQEVLGRLTKLQIPVMNWLKLFIAPQQVFSAILHILPYGVFSINGWIVNGIPLIILWILECALLILVPYYLTAYYCGRPYDEDLHIWLPKREEWKVTYVTNYREIRTQMRKGNCAALLDALDDVKGYVMKGQESYAVLEFYSRGKFVGPYISLTNIKAVQSGPRKLDHRMVRLCRMFDIGTDEAKRLYDRVMESYEAAKRSRDQSDQQKMGDKISMAQFDLNRASVNVASEIRHQGKESDEQYVVRPTETFLPLDTGNLEDVSIHVPRVTPEMEQAYIDRKKKK